MIGFFIYIGLSFSLAPVEWTPGVNIIQHGMPRTASTFQYQLLCIAAILKAEQFNLSVSCQYHRHNVSADINVIKTHAFSESESLWKGMPRKHLFVSVQNNESARNLQSKPTFRNVALFQIYADFVLRTTSSLLDYTLLLQLSHDEVVVMHEYLRYWQVLRRCCGSQASIDWRSEMHNSSLRAHDLHAPDSIDCHLYNLDAVEQRLRNSVACLQFGGKTLQRYVEGHYPAGLQCPVDQYCRLTLRDLKAGFDINGLVWNG